MRINIAASHRFHLLDLARELEKQGHQIHFYSYLPKNKAIQFGLKSSSNHSLFIIMVPFLILEKFSNRAFWAIAIKNVFMDFLVSVIMRPCDVFIGLGSVYKKSFLNAKNKFNAITVLEWGSKHIIEQRAQFNEISRTRYPDFFFNRDLFAYGFVDYISIPSKHVEESFLKHGISKEKLLVNPYGVDLASFYPTELSDISYDIIMVGGWRFEKGADLIIDFCKRNPNITFLHVGAIVNLEFPKIKNMTHVDSVKEKELVNYYAKAKIFILPSRSEGLAMVQIQAIACGLPIVCSKDTGGRDLREYITDPKWIIELENNDQSQLLLKVEEALVLAKKQNGFRSYAPKINLLLSWKAYGIRYNHNLLTLKKQL